MARGVSQWVGQRLRIRARVFSVSVALLLLLGSTSAQSAPESTQQTFERVRSDLQRLPLPADVSEVVRSLSQPLNLSINCPQGSAVQTVSITVTTTLQQWDSALQAQSSDRAGVYLWRGSVRTGPQEKTITFDNVLAFDPAALTGTDSGALSPLDTLTDRTLVYHELLHGQLLIDAMQSSEAWREGVCAGGGPDLTPSDADHSEIPRLEQTLATRLAERTPNLFALRITPEEAQQGRFSVTLGPLDDLLSGSSGFRAAFRTSTGSNVRLGEVRAALEGGNVIVRGALRDPSEAGFLLVQLQPPAGS